MGALMLSVNNTEILIKNKIVIEKVKTAQWNGLNLKICPFKLLF